MPKIKQSFQEIIEVMSEFSYLAAIFLGPLFFAYFFPTYNIFELDKIVLFRILSLLLLLFTAFKVIFLAENCWFFKSTKKERKIFLKKYLAIPTLLIVSLFFSLLFSLNPTQSFFGSYERQEGLISQLFYWLFFILLIVNLLWSNSPEKVAKKIKRIILTIIASASLIGLYGILQILGLDFLNWPEEPFLTHRALSTFGQPNFLASFLLLPLPVTLYYFWQSRRFLIKSLFLLALFCQLLGLFFTASRGAFVALGLVVLVFFGYIFVRGQISRRQKISLLALSFGLVLVFFIAFSYFLPGRLNSLFDLQGGSLAARVNFYTASAEAILQKPFFGYGLENGGEVFIRHYQPDWGIYGDVDASTDRAHNLLLDILLNVGFIGLIFYGLFYYAFFKIGLENLSKKFFNQNLVGLSTALLFGALGYLISLMFSFPFVAGEIYFWTFFALLIVINFNFSNYQVKPISDQASVKSENRKKIISRRSLAIRLIIFGLFLVFAGWQANRELKILSADYYFNQLYYTLANRDYFKTFVLDDYLRAVAVNPVNQEYYNRFLGEKLSDFYSDISLDLATKKVADEKLTLILSELDDQTYKNWLVKAKIFRVLKNYDLSFYYFKKLGELTPFWPRNYLEQARSFAKINNFPQALLNYNLANLNLPSLEDRRLNNDHRQVVAYYQSVIYQEMADIYFKEAKYPLAIDYYSRAFKNYPTDFTLYKKIADAYYLQGNINEAIIYNERGLSRAPNDYNWSLALAILYQDKGDLKRAQEYLLTAKKLAPDNPEVLKIGELLKVKYE